MAPSGPFSICFGMFRPWSAADDDASPQGLRGLRAEGKSPSMDGPMPVLRTERMPWPRLARRRTRWRTIAHGANSDGMIGPIARRRTGRKAG